MLRSGGKTYVCDVNGFSFVKTSDKYYQDCAFMVKKIIYRKLGLKWIDAEVSEDVSIFKKANKAKINKIR
jgi:hypothetical protein